MKKVLFLSICVLAISFTSNAQNDNIENAAKRLHVLGGNEVGYNGMASYFEKLIKEDKSEWLAKYYTSYCLIMQAQHSSKSQVSDSLLLVANKFLISEKELDSKAVKDDGRVENSKNYQLSKRAELLALKAMSLAVKMKNVNADAQTAYITEIGTLLEKVSRFDKENSNQYFAEALRFVNTSEPTPATLNNARTALGKMIKLNQNEKKIINLGNSEAEFLLGTMH